MRELNRFKGCLIGGATGDALGFDAIPRKYLDRLELKDVIIEIAEDLHHDFQITEYGYGIICGRANISVCHIAEKPKTQRDPKTQGFQVSD